MLKKTYMRTTDISQYLPPSGNQFHCRLVEIRRWFMHVVSRPGRDFQGSPVRRSGDFPRKGDPVANDDSEKIIHTKIAQLEADIASLRDGYMIVNKRYAHTLDSMKLLTQSALEAALRAANAAEKAAQASKNAAAAAMASANAKIIDATHAATEAASLAAVAAAEAAAAASAAAAAAAAAAAIQAEESSNQASAEAARATMRATEAAAEAAKMAHMAAEAAKSLK
jgi:hypothetical protein